MQKQMAVMATNYGGWSPLASPPPLSMSSGVYLKQLWDIGRIMNALLTTLYPAPTGRKSKQNFKKT